MQSAASVERYFQFSLLGLISTAYFALAASGFLDRTTLILTFLGLLVRAGMVTGILRFRLPISLVTAAALGYVVFFPIDLYFVSREFLPATVHGVCFLATVKILTAQSTRDYVYTGAISFVELAAAAILSVQSSFLGYLALYVAFAIATFTSAEIRRRYQSGRIAAPPHPRAITWRLALIAVSATAGILVITLGLFLIVPRTARMAAMLFPNAPRLTGFSNEVDLGGFGSISRDDRAVLHIRAIGRGFPAGIKWRGAALSQFDGKRWSEPPLPGRIIPTVNGYAQIANDLQRSRVDRRRILYHVDVQNSGTGTLFVAGVPEFVNADFRNVLVNSEGALRVLAGPGEALRYDVSAYTGPPLEAPLTRVERARYLDLPPLDVRIYQLARQWAGDDANEFERALRIQNHLQRDFKYALESSATPVGDPLSDFLFVRKQGYCEYFASAMAVMLRAERIPARIATGFQSGYYNDVSGLYVVRASDAHAWVEAWLPGRGWTTFDPTPVGTEAAPGLFSRLDMYFDAMDHAWREWVVAYDLNHQVAIAARFESAMRGLSRHRTGPNTQWSATFIKAVRKRGAAAAGIGLVLTLLVWFCPRGFRLWRDRARLKRIMRSGGTLSDASLLYQRMLDTLARKGYEKPGFFTPQEFAATLPATEGAPIREFTAVYNSIRFGGNASATARLAGMLQELERR